jgi:hypothetical protein
VSEQYGIDYKPKLVHQQGVRLTDPGDPGLDPGWWIPIFV